MKGKDRHSPMGHEVRHGVLVAASVVTVNDVVRMLSYSLGRPGCNPGWFVACCPELR